MPNHLISTDVPDEARGRGLLVEKLEIFPVECVVRGYLSGSGWKEYKQCQAVCGIELPSGLRESDRLPEPIFTPATKAELGDHDENVDFDRAAEIVGDRATMEELRRLSLEVYARGAEHAESNGHHPGRHEVRVRARRRTATSCSPTRSSRRTPRDSGPPTSTSRAAASLLSTSSTCATGSTRPGGTTRRPAPSCRPRSSEATRAKYVEAYERIAGQPFERWLDTLRVRVLIRPKEGILDPQGQAVERALPALGYEGVSNVHVGRLVELDVDGDGDVEAQVARDVRAAAREPADRELRGPGFGRDRMSARVGIVVFPGSCDEARRAPGRRARRASSRSTCGTPTATCRASTRVIVPGGFSYGDYLRAGRDRALLRR